jgi:hypothetical protein
MTKSSSTDRLKDSIKLKIEAINLKYNIRREYFTVGIPLIVAVMLVMFAVMTGHTLFEDKNSKSPETSDREKALEELIKQMEAEERGEVYNPTNTSATTGEDTESASGKIDLDHYLIYAAMVAITPYSIDRFFQRREKRRTKRIFPSSCSSFRSS